jgi:hypothetical protein
MTSATGQDLDDRLIDEAVDVCHDARRRAPREFLRMLTVILVAVAIALVVIAALTGGLVHDLSLNLSAEVIGALLTVVLIDGLWHRLETGASSSLEDMSRSLEAHRAWPMTDEERQAWRVFVDEYRALVSASSPLDRARALPNYRRRIRALEARGNRTLAIFQSDAAETTRSGR